MDDTTRNTPRAAQGKSAAPLRNIGELAATWNVPVDEVLQTCEMMGLEGVTASSRLDETTARELRERLENASVGSQGLLDDAFGGPAIEGENSSAGSFSVFNADLPMAQSSDDYGQTIAPGSARSASQSAAARKPIVRANLAVKESPDDYGQTIAPAGSRSPSSSSPDGDYGATVVGGGRSGGSSNWSRAGAGRSAFGGDGNSDSGFRVVRELGKGGMGVVQIARDPRIDRWVAVKRLSGDFANDEGRIDRFMTEARAAGKLSNFHLVQVYDVGEDGDGPYISMEYVPGPYPSSDTNWPSELPNPPLDVEACVRRDGPFEIHEAIAICIKLCSGLGYAHRKDVIHRDVKPGNILLNEDREPKVADFGLARQQSSDELGMTQAGTRMLTLGYGAPEQETDASKVDCRADVYGIGATLWFMLTGHNPRHFRESEVPDVLREVLSKAMMKDRERRYQTADELAKALELARSRASMSGSSAPSGARYAEGQRLPVGDCYGCGHHHGGDADSRKFCAACGSSLQTSCLKCGYTNPLWAQYCGDCSASLHEQLKDTQQKFTSYQEAFPGAVERLELKAAQSWINHILSINDPRLRAIGEWARDQSPLIQQATDRAYAMSQEAIADAQELIGGESFLEACMRLDELPSELRERGDVVAIRRSAEDSAVTVRRLVQQIDAAMNGDSYVLAAQLAADLAKVSPNHPSVQSGQEFYERRWMEVEAAAYSDAMIARDLTTMASYLATYEGVQPEERTGTVVRRYRGFLREAVGGSRHADDATRDIYIARRTPSQLRLDLIQARWHVAIATAIPAIAIGGILGAIVGAFADATGGLIAGSIVGVVVGVVLMKKD